MIWFDMGASEGLKASLNLNKNLIDYYDLIPNDWLLWFDSKWLIIIIRFQMIEYYDLIPNTNINRLFQKLS